VPVLRTHMPELDTIRGLAILGVLFYHGLYWARDLSVYAPWQRRILTLAAPGQFGVNLFFVLSGFLITGILVDSRNRPDYYSRFYFRRALRILPAYYGTLLVLVCFGLTSRGFLYMSLLYSSNLSLIFGITMSYPVLWSLAVEEHFYFLWPAAVRRIAPERLTLVAAWIVVLSPVLRSLCYPLGSLLSFLRTGCSYYTWNVADGLALGSMVALLVRKWGGDRFRLKQLSLLFFAVGTFIGIVGCPFGIATRMTTVGEALQWVPWNFYFGGTLVLFLLAGSSRWKRIVTPRVLIFFGKISYGLYLSHLMLFCLYHWLAKRTNFEELWRLNVWERTWMAMSVAGGAAVLVSYLSRLYFEEPFLRLKDALPGRSRTSNSTEENASASERELVPAKTTQRPFEKFPST